MLNRSKRARENTGYPRDACTELTAYEQRVLRLYARFRDVAAVGDELGRTRVAVYKTLEVIRKKTHANTNAEALKRAIDLRILPASIRIANPLSLRERQILTGVLGGGSAATIAEELGVSRSVVKNFYTIAKAKLRVDSVPAAASRAESLGLLDSAVVSFKTAQALERQRPSVELTPRQEEMLALIDAGVHGVMQLAERLAIQPQTAKLYLRHVKKKLGVRTIREIPMRARQMGFIARRRSARGHERHSLTQEQMAVLRGLGAGLNQVAIALQLGVQRRVIVAHAASLRRYFGVRRTSDIAPAARRRAIIT